MTRNKQQLIQYLVSLDEEQFHAWVETAPLEEVDIALEYYKYKQHLRVEAELKKYESHALDAIKKAMKK